MLPSVRERELKLAAPGSLVVPNLADDGLGVISMDELTERFLVISGDVVTDIDLGEIVRFHDERDALATIVYSLLTKPHHVGEVTTREGRDFSLAQGGRPGGPTPATSCSG